jgi:hypothetical protein
MVNNPIYPCVAGSLAWLFLLLPALGNMCVISLLLYAAYTARQTCRGRSNKHYRAMPRTRVRFAGIDEDLNNEMKVNNCHEKESTDVESMYELIPQEYLENNFEKEVTSHKRIESNDEFAITHYGFDDNENAQEMWRILANPKAYQKALKVLGRVDTKRPSDVRKISTKSLQIHTRRPSDYDRARFRRSISLHADPRKARTRSLTNSYQKMRSISEEHETVYETILPVIKNNHRKLGTIENAFSDTER